MNELAASISEQNGLDLCWDSDRTVFCPGVSTAGRAEIELARRNPLRKIIATTIDAAGLSHTEAEIERCGCADQIEIRMEDIREALPYGSEFFDFIYARLILHYLNHAELDAVVPELYRVLKPGGRCFAVVRSITDRAFNRAGSVYDAETCFTTYPAVDGSGRESGKTISRYFHSKESLTGHFERAEFRVVKLTEYEEQLYCDYLRTERAEAPAALIEAVFRK